MNSPWGLDVNEAGDLFFADCMSNYVRKVGLNGVINQFAGTCGTFGYFGEGVSATIARFSNVWDVKTDVLGNVFISEGNTIIRKVNPSGIITTVAGNRGSFSGDGGPATSAGIDNWGIAVDLIGNLYIADRTNNRIRKVNTTGIISTIAGTGIAGYSGDGGPATIAQLNYPSFIVADKIGNLYFTEARNHCVRKISASGIISTVAGNGHSGYNGDGIKASHAKLNEPSGIAIDRNGDILVCDGGNDRIRKIGLREPNCSDSFCAYVSDNCSGAVFTFITQNYVGGMFVKTFFGDGTSSSDLILRAPLGGYSTINHKYAFPGVYSVKHLLINGSAIIDSMTYTQEHKLCNTLSLKLYFDENGNCRNDSAVDFPISRPVTIDIDSNGVIIDKITTSGGVYYNAYGNAGDVYKYTVRSMPAGYFTTCPVSGVIFDTLRMNSELKTAKNIGFNCSSIPGHDLGVVASLRAKTDECMGTIMVWNDYCNPKSGTLTLNMSPKYIYKSSSLTPSVVADNLVTWDLNNLSSSTSAPYAIHFVMQKPAGIPNYMPRDTVNSTYIISPSIDDVNSSNNTVIRIDTVRSGYDPNYVAVNPEGNIAASTWLTYTIGFENTGNDTAHNIFVLDTLSPYIDISTLEVIAASSNFYLSIMKKSTIPVVKFDFSNIMLPDSSHHNLCHGMVVFKVKAKTYLPIGTLISNNAGIYFDYNPVVNTNTVYDIISAPSKVDDLNDENEVKIYPNPTSDIFNLETTEDQYESYTLTNCLGQLLLSGNINSTHTTIDVSKLPVGVYSIFLKGSKGSSVKKIVKK